MPYFRYSFLAYALAFSGITFMVHADDDVRCIQTALSNTAFSVRLIDGNWGRQTSEAVNGIYKQLEFQSENHKKENAPEICKTLTNLSDEEKEKVSVRQYPVEIDPEDIVKVANGPIYDFSRVKIDSTKNENCQFTIKRRAFEDDRREVMASGEFRITAGHIFFGQHSWETGGLADDTYLKDQSNLSIDVKGRVFGIMPFFHMFVRPGEEAPVPFMVELGKKRKLDEIREQSSIWFDVNSWGDGFIQIYNCVPTK